MRVRRTREHDLIQPRDELVGWLGEITRDLLLNRALFLFPFRVGVDHVAHAGGVDAQGDVEIGRWHRRKILRDGLLCGRVVEAAELGKDRGNLIRGHIRASAERHVLLRVRHARKPGRRFVGADQIVLHDGDHRRERIADDDHTETVVERRTRDAASRWRLRERRLGCQEKYNK
jgi:hypothetical protein